MADDSKGTNYLKELLTIYYPMHFFALFRAHELRSVAPYLDLLQDPILDLGCGDGRIAELLFQRELAYGIDVDARAVHRAEQLGEYTQTWCQSAHAIPLDDNTLGGIYSNCVLEHIPDIPGLIHEISRVLKPNSYFVGTAMTPHYYAMNPVFQQLNRSGWQWLRQRMIDTENRVHHHISLYDKDEYAEMFAAAGMVLEQHAYFAPQPVVDFYACWDTLSKYWFPLQPRLNHHGLLMMWLQVWHRLENKAKRIEKWQAQLDSLYQMPTSADEIGAAQILVARKL